MSKKGRFAMVEIEKSACYREPLNVDVADELARKATMEEYRGHCLQTVFG